MASVCAVGLVQIEQSLGGWWAVVAISLAGLLCLVLARALARLTNVLPSGAGFIAFLSRVFNRPFGILVVLPYFLLMLLLVGFEALIVGELIARLIPVPVIVNALGFLVLTWAICRAGIRIGYLAQALSTWALFACLIGIALATLTTAAQQGELSHRLSPAWPGLTELSTGVGQALFLFMGFELLTSHVEVTSPQTIGRALSGSVWVLIFFYALLALGFACLTDLPMTSSGFVLPQLLIAEQTGQISVVILVIVTSFLASFSSFNGALLALSRFIYALANQGLLPRYFSHLEPKTLTARSALWLLLGLTMTFTMLLYFFSFYHATILAAAVAVTFVYATTLWTRERPPFREEQRSIYHRLISGGIAFFLLALGVGIIITANEVRLSVLILLIIAYGTALGLLLKIFHAKSSSPRKRNPTCPSI